MYPQSSTHNLCFEQNKKIITLSHLKITIFINTDLKNRSILHRHVCVMSTKPTNLVLLPPKKDENDFMLTQVNVCHLKKMCELQMLQQ